MSKSKQTDEQRFWSKVDKTPGLGPDGDCWEWAAGAHPKGYGVFTVGNQSKRANRVAFALTKGEIPAKLYVCHTCDNRLCVNPAHLFLGTAMDNIRDMYAKGRSIKSMRDRTEPIGDYPGAASFTQRLLARRTYMEARRIATAAVLMPAPANRGARKLTEQDVLLLRQDFRDGKFVDKKQLCLSHASRTGVSYHGVFDALNGKRCWRHLPHI